MTQKRRKPAAGSAGGPSGMRDLADQRPEDNPSHGVRQSEDDLRVEHAGRLIGTIATRQHGFDARPSTGGDLGRYNSIQAAARALLAHASGAP